MKKIYALYKGENLLADGTLKEIAEQMGLKEKTLLFYGTPTYQHRAKKVRNRLALVRLYHLGD